MNLETASVNIIEMGWAVKASTVPDKHNKGYVEAEILPEGAIGIDELLPEKHQWSCRYGWRSKCSYCK